MYPTRVGYIAGTAGQDTNMTEAAAADEHAARNPEAASPETPQPDVEPERTEHPAGADQAEVNRENEPPG
jgi:hypothetical protein